MLVNKNAAGEGQGIITTTVAFYASFGATSTAVGNAWPSARGSRTIAHSKEGRANAISPLPFPDHQSKS